jgi:hypothetical protein
LISFSQYHNYCTETLCLPNLGTFSSAFAALEVIGLNNRLFDLADWEKEQVTQAAKQA